MLVWDEREMMCVNKGGGLFVGIFWFEIIVEVEVFDIVCVLGIVIVDRNVVVDNDNLDE